MSRRPRIVASSLALATLAANAETPTLEVASAPVGQATTPRKGRGRKAAPEPTVTPEPTPVLEAAPVEVAATPQPQKPEAPLCLCGCGIQTSSVRRIFRQGHDARLVGFVSRGALADGSEPSPAQVLAAAQIRCRKAEAVLARLTQASAKPVLEAATDEEIAASNENGALVSNVG